MDESDRCHVEYSVAKWCRLLGLSNRKQLGIYALTLQEQLNVNVEANHNRMRIEIPNLLKKRDNYTRDRQETSKRLPRDLTDTSKQEVDVEVDVEVDKEKGKRKGKTFKPPSLIEVEEYIEQNGYSVSAQQFIDYHEARGWMLGKGKMKCWRAAVRTWTHREPPKPKMPDFMTDEGRKKLGLDT